MNPEIQLVVLIPHQRFVEQTDTFERFLVPAAVNDRVNVAFVVLVVESGAAAGKRTIVCGRDRSLDDAAGLGASGSSDIVGTGLLKIMNARRDVIGGVLR